MKFTIHILLSSLLLTSTPVPATASSDTDSYIAALAQLLEQKTIGDAELVTLLEAAEDGKIVNPISAVRAETSVEHFVANNALEEMLQAEIYAPRVAAWAKENINEQDHVRKKREQAQNATISVWKEELSVLSVRDRHACAVSIDGTVRCWGDNDFEQSSPPKGAFKSVSVGREHSCGIRLDGTVVCWGENGYKQLNAPPGTFKSLSASAARTCGLKDDGTVKCWGFLSEYYTPAGVFRSFSASASGDSYCGIRIDDSVECFSPFFTGNLSGKFRSVSVGGTHACGVRFDGTVRCWGDNRNGQCNPSPGSFQSVAAASGYTCGLRTDGTIECWGGDDVNPAPSARSGRFYAISSRLKGICAVGLDGSVECWGNNAYDLSPPFSLLISTGQANETSPFIAIINSFMRRFLLWSGLS